MMLRGLILIAVLLQMSPFGRGLSLTQGTKEDANTANWLPWQLVEQENDILQIYDEHIKIQEQRIRMLKR